MASFVSRIDPEFESIRPSPPIVHSPTLDLLDASTLGNGEQLSSSHDTNPVSELPETSHELSTPKEAEKCPQENTVSTPNSAAKSSNAPRYHKRRGRGSKKNNDKGWKRRERNNTRS